MHAITLDNFVRLMESQRKMRLGIIFKSEGERMKITEKGLNSTILLLKLEQTSMLKLLIKNLKFAIKKRS